MARYPLGRKWLEDYARRCAQRALQVWAGSTLAPERKRLFGATSISQMDDRTLALFVIWVSTLAGISKFKREFPDEPS